MLCCLIATFAPFILRAYFNRPGKPIRIVIPIGYQGEFSIIHNSNAAQGPKLQNGVWIFEIPPDGKLEVNDDSPFYRWHKESYVYTNGQTAHVEDLGTSSEGVHTWKVVNFPSQQHS